MMKCVADSSTICSFVRSEIVSLEQRIILPVRMFCIYFSPSGAIRNFFFRDQERLFSTETLNTSPCVVCVKTTFGPSRRSDSRPSCVDLAMRWRRCHHHPAPDTVHLPHLISTSADIHGILLSLARLLSHLLRRPRLRDFSPVLVVTFFAPRAKTVFLLSFSFADAAMVQLGGVHCGSSGALSPACVAIVSAGLAARGGTNHR